MTKPGEGQIVNLQVTEYDDGKNALKAIFDDRNTVTCMEARLKNTDMQRNREKVKAKRLEALDAFLK